MPAHVIAAAASVGAGRSASQAIARAASTAGTSPLILDVEGDPRTCSRSRPALPVPFTVVDAPMAAALLAERDRTSVTIVHLIRPLPATLGLLLPFGDCVVIPGTRLGRDLDDAADLYASISAMDVEGASGQLLKPWLLPAGWSCSRNPGVRLWGWRRQLERRSFADRLRCLPMIIPWTEVNSLSFDVRDRVEAIGARLLGYLTDIADGHAPSRPATGLAGGDPWPDTPSPCSVASLPWVQTPQSAAGSVTP